MRPHTGNRVITSLHLGHDGVVIRGIKPSPIAHLPSSLRIKRRVIKNHLARLASFEFPHSLSVANDRQHFGVLRPRLPVPFELRFRKLLISRIRRLLRRPLPRSPSPFSLLLHGVVEAASVESDASIAASILDEVSRQAERVI